MPSPVKVVGGTAQHSRDSVGDAGGEKKKDTTLRYGTFHQPWRP